MKSTRMFLVVLVAQVLATATGANPLHFAAEGGGDNFTGTFRDEDGGGQPLSDVPDVEQPIQAASAGEAKEKLEGQMDARAGEFGRGPEEQNVDSVTDLDTGKTTEFEV